jgi:3-oxoadipate enol-lactonase
VEHQQSLHADSAVSPVVTHRTFSSPQLQMAIQGQGTPVVLSHALGLDMRMWDAFANRLSSGELGARFHVIRYDHRGHGKSEIAPGPYTMDDLVDDAARAIHESGRWPVVWIGLSMGAMVGQGLAIRYPELISHLVLANTTARYPPTGVAAWAQRIATVEVGGMPAVVETVVERYLHAGFRAADPEATRLLREVLLGNAPSGYAASCSAVAHVDWLDRLHEVRSPTLVIAGALDAGAPPAMGQAIADRIPGARMHVIDQASHLSVLETPETFERAVAEFLIETTQWRTTDEPNVNAMTALAVALSGDAG